MDCHIFGSQKNIISALKVIRQYYAIDIIYFVEKFVYETET